MSCVFVSRTVFRMSLVMVVRRVLCSKEQCKLPEDDRVIETRRNVLNVLM